MFAKPIPSLLAFAFVLGLAAHAPSALAQPGTVIAWNTGGRLVPAGLTDVVQVASGNSHSLARKSDGTVVAWGDNSYGQTAVPAALTDPATADAVDVAAGALYGLAVRSDGTVVAWGHNSYGQTAVPAALTDPATADAAQVAGGFAHGLARKADGSVVGWGWNDYGQVTVPAGLSDVTQVAAGSSHSLALKSDGTVVAWGDNRFNQAAVPAVLTDPATANVVQIAAGPVASYVVRGDGTVMAWGDNSYSQTTVPAALTNPATANIVQVAGGDYYSLALKGDGTVVEWGNSAYLKAPKGLTGVTQIALTSTQALSLDGELPAITGDGGPTTANGFPIHPPVFVPTTGGTAHFAATLTNNRTIPLMTEVWLGVRFPDGTLVVKRRAQTLTIQPGAPHTITGGFDLPEAFPDGTYTLYGYFGTHPNADATAMAITIEKTFVMELKAGTTLSMTTEEILALDLDAFLTLDAASATASAPDGPELPTATTLGSAYPNPFNPSATVPFSLAEAAAVRLAVYDVLGREVAVLVDGRVEAGSHSVRFEAGSLPSGTYLVRFAANGHTQTQRLTLVK